MTRLSACLALVLALVLGGAAGAAGGPLQDAMRGQDILLRPPGEGPFAAAILLHGCGGPSRRERLWAERLRDWGILSLRVDSFTVRGLRRVCGGGIFEAAERVPDLQAALAHLRTRSEVRGDRVAVLGWSHGAMAVLAALAAAPDGPGLGLRAAVAFYPGCRRAAPWRAETPALLLLGAADDWTAAEPCRALAERQARAGLPVASVVYPGAYHGFDNPYLGAGPRRAADALGGRGATLQYDAEAAADSLLRVRAFLVRHLGA